MVDDRDLARLEALDQVLGPPVDAGAAGPCAWGAALLTRRTHEGGDRSVREGRGVVRGGATPGPGAATVRTGRASKPFGTARLRRPARSRTASGRRRVDHLRERHGLAGQVERQTTEQRRRCGSPVPWRAPRRGRCTPPTTLAPTSPSISCSRRSGTSSPRAGPDGDATPSNSGGARGGDRQGEEGDQRRSSACGRAPGRRGWPGWRRGRPARRRAGSVRASPTTGPARPRSRPPRPPKSFSEPVVNRPWRRAPRWPRNPPDSPAPARSSSRPRKPRPRARISTAARGASVDRVRAPSRAIHRSAARSPTRARRGG